MRWFRKKSKVAVSSLRIGTDIHTHLLPGVDDGRFTFGSAAETLSQMYDKGLDRVYLTPHMIAGLYENSHEKLHDALKGVKDCVGTATIPEISLGAEYMIDETLLPYI